MELTSTYETRMAILQYCCEDPASFEVLETNGANLNVKNNSNEGFLEKATELAQEDNTEMVTYLFNRDLIPVNFFVSRTSSTAMLWSTSNKYIPQLATQLLLHMHGKTTHQNNRDLQIGTWMFVLRVRTRAIF